MKTLLLMRHAKSSWDEPVSDFDRSLNKRGRESAPRMGKYFDENHLTADLILCSPAKRTRQTLELFQDKAKLSCAIEFDKRIYEADVADLLDVLSEIPEPHRSVLMIGHNPGMSDLHEFFTGNFEEFPTACLAHLTLSAPLWKELKPKSGKLESITRPKEIDY